MMRKARCESLEFWVCVGFILFYSAIGLSGKFGVVDGDFGDEREMERV